MSEIKYPEIEVQLTGEDGNAYAVLGAVARALKKGPFGDMETFQTEEEAYAAAGEFMAEAMSSDYDHLLQTAMQTVTVL